MPTIVDETQGKKVIIRVELGDTFEHISYSTTSRSFTLTNPSLVKLGLYPVFVKLTNEAL